MNKDQNIDNNEEKYIIELILLIFEEMPSYELVNLIFEKMKIIKFENLIMI